MKPYQQKKLVLLVLVTALVIRIAFIFWSQNYISPKTFEYGEIAQNFLVGGGYSAGPFLPDETEPVGPSAQMAPVYVFLEVFSMKILKGYGFLAMQVLQALISSIICLFIYLIARQLWDEKTAIISLLLTALYPMLIYYVKILEPTIFASFFLSAIIFLVIKTSRRPSFIEYAMVGFLFGVGGLTEPVMLVFLPFGMAWLVFNSKASKTEACKGAVAIAVIAGLIILPWTIRNYKVFNRFVPIKSTFGLNLWVGNNSLATGHEFTHTGQHMLRTLTPEDRRYLAGLDEATRWQVLEKRAIDFIKNNPSQFFKLLGKKFYYFWWMPDKFNFANFEGVHGRYISKYVFLRKFVLASLLSTALLGFFLSIKIIKKTSLLLLLFLSYSGLYVITFAGHTRFMIPLEPLLLTFSAHNLNSLRSIWNSFKKRIV